MAQERISDAPTIIELADQILRRHDHVIEEDFTELVIAGNGPDRPDRDPGAVQID